MLNTYDTQLPLQPGKAGICMMSPEELRPEMKRRLQDVTDVLMFQTQQLSSSQTQLVERVY
jgi:hypothetical protein